MHDRLRGLPLAIIPDSCNKLATFQVWNVILSLSFFYFLPLCFLLGMKIRSAIICIWLHFLSLCDEVEILIVSEGWLDFLSSLKYIFVFCVHC